MSERVSIARARAADPMIGAWVPTATIHVALLVVAAALCVVVLDAPFWRGVGLLLAVVVTLAPNVVAAWWLIFALALSQLWRTPSATDMAFYVLLAGVHLLHMLASLARLLPWKGRMQVAALVRPFRRFVLIQAVSQSVAVGALLTFGGGRGTVTGLSVLTAVVLGVVAVVLGRGVYSGSGSVY